MSELKEGDRIVVNFHNAAFTLVGDGELISMPRATGDSWVVKDAKGVIHYISEGCTITKKG